MLDTLKVSNDIGIKFLTNAEILEVARRPILNSGKTSFRSWFASNFRVPVAPRQRKCTFDNGYIARLSRAFFRNEE
jgi:hypothetical protein